MIRSLRNLVTGACFVILCLTSQAVFGQEEPAEQDDVSKALDSTATQWSFQFAYQDTSWKDDMVNGQPRRPGHDNFVQSDAE